MPEVLRFERFEVHASERQLLVEGRVAAIGSRAFDLLLVLIKHRDRVVPKRELLASVWPDMVVEENNLHVQVGTLRKLIGAGAVATVQGRGYRFTLGLHAPLQQEPETAPGAFLPAASALIGREGEVVELSAVLQDRPLVSLVGPGGIGKTQLALCVAHALRGAFADGVCWIDLSGVGDPRLVASMVAKGLGLPWADNAPLAALASAVADRRALLVIDNIEHVLDAVTDLALAVMSARGHVRFLATSRVPMRIDLETVFRVGVLPIPPERMSAEAAVGYGAIALFVRQAQAEDRHFTLTDANVERVVAVCRHLDGVPLALKLAAARLATLGLDELSARLHDTMRLLRDTRRGLPVRQGTMEAALDWSHDLLGETDRTILRRLSVFVGGFALPAAIVVNDDEDEWHLVDALQRLADCSLLEVCRAADALTRYRLPECTRQYAAARLAHAGEGARYATRHACAMTRLMEDAYEDYWRLGDAAWLRRTEPELDNVRLALDGAAGEDPALARRLIGAACPLFMLLGLAPEARRRCVRLEPAVGEHALQDPCARYWLERSRLEWGISCAAQLSHARLALAAAQTTGDARGIYLALRCVAAAAPLLGTDESQRILADMVTLEAPDWGVRLRSQRLLASAAVLQARSAVDEAAAALHALLALEGIEDLAVTQAAAWINLAHLALQAGDDEGALRWTEPVLARRGAERGNFALLALAARATVWLRQGRLGDAQVTLQDCAQASRLCSWEWLSLHADVLAWLAAAQGRAEDAARVLGHADAARLRLGPRDANALQARAKALALCARTLSASRLEAERSAGAALDEHGACVHALGAAWSVVPDHAKRIVAHPVAVNVGAWAR